MVSLVGRLVDWLSGWLVGYLLLCLLLKGGWQNSVIKIFESQINYGLTSKVRITNISLFHVMY